MIMIWPIGSKPKDVGDSDANKLDTEGDMPQYDNS